MDSLIIQVLNGSASPFEEERLRRWREEAPENEEYFQEMSAVWALTKPEPVVVRSGPPPVDVILEAGGDAPSGPSPIPETSTSPPLAFAGRDRPSLARGRGWMKWGLLAASVAAVAIGVQAVGFGGPEPTAVYQVASGETTTFTLEDGSFVRLAEGARLREWAVEGRREVSLEGRAFFAVARDEDRPFSVKTSAGEIRVLGTRFQVDATERESETLVVEGLVRVSNEIGAVEVPAGSLARMRSSEVPTSEPLPDVYGLMNWPQGTLIFQGTPLSQVALEVSRQYGRSVEVTDSGLANRQVTAWFEGESFEIVTESLCLVTEALCSRSETGVTMGFAPGVGD
jgi:ferric-dicitrate binding protein FerR (iron transport regulator)